MLVAQISDLHVVPEGERAYGRVDTGALLHRALTALASGSPRPDWIVATGDLTQSGRYIEYARLREALVGVGISVLPVVGNHDSRVELRRAFGDDVDLSGADGFIQYAVDLGGLRLVVLDTVTTGSDEPSFCNVRAEWLERALAESNAPTLLAMHHPPFASGIEWLEPQDPTWAAPLFGILEGAPHVVRIIAGHVHRAIHGTVQGIPVSTAPSTAHQVFPDFAGRPPLLSTEAPGFQLHRWADSQLTTYTVSIPGFAETFVPSQKGTGW